ncbi:uncharacterized protein LOC129762161 [Toxorhynchites rutilus septentrionalis]|uniref:uncharacterized protein LOC129762161 n=1 Tax=Toxorhynchites rutilus septentrionalis TaxID=329112 RepID=UPI00247A413B|nr:uncharacterized protein LOC129762161 [Toxorhynchites rutilus septentrionalis]
MLSYYRVHSKGHRRDQSGSSYRQRKGKAYFSGDVPEVPPQEVAAFVNYCREINKDFIIGCDANAHHTMWASTDINYRAHVLSSRFITLNEPKNNRKWLSNESQILEDTSQLHFIMR